jgi:hypothetical protein
MTARCGAWSLAGASGLDRIDLLYAHDLDIFNHGSQAAQDERLEAFMAGGYRALVACATKA